jgi:hypothetical protein
MGGRVLVDTSRARKQSQSVKSSRLAIRDLRNEIPLVCRHAYRLRPLWQGILRGEYSQGVVRDGGTGSEQRLCGSGTEHHVGARRPGGGRRRGRHARVRRRRCPGRPHQWWDIPALLGERLGTGLFGGVLAHYANGIVFAIVFAGLIPVFRGPIWLRAVQFATLQTIFGVWLFMMPIMGMGALGLKMGAMMPVMTLIRHWVYGAVMGLMYVRLVPR